MKHKNTKPSTNQPEIPISYPKIKPPEAATMQVMITETVSFPPYSFPSRLTAKAPPAIFFFPAVATVSSFRCLGLIDRFVCDCWFGRRENAYIR